MTFNINHDSDTPKYLQIINAVNNAIANNELAIGEALPSVNYICSTYKISRDTIFKAYSILKEKKVIIAVPNKGYYVASDIRKVLLVLDTFKAYKEVLYHSFINNLPDNVIADVQFHHYNIENFKTILNSGFGKYYKYVIMNFDNPEVEQAIKQFPKDKLLLIDWKIHNEQAHNYLCQDFGNAFYNVLKEAAPLFRKYKALKFIYPDFTNHPKDAVVAFKKFCKDFQFKNGILTASKKFKIEKDCAYISVSDRMLGNFLEQCREFDLEPGNHVGMLSYNETPMKKFIHKGISVVSTNFNELGTKAAEFVTTDGSMKHTVPTTLTLRKSL